MKLFCILGYHSWMYQRGDPMEGPNRMCRWCMKSQTWKRGWHSAQMPDDAEQENFAGGLTQETNV